MKANIKDVGYFGKKYCGRRTCLRIKKHSYYGMCTSNTYTPTFSNRLRINIQIRSFSFYIKYYWKSPTFGYVFQCCLQVISWWGVEKVFCLRYLEREENEKARDIFLLFLFCLVNYIFKYFLVYFKKKHLLGEKRKIGRIFFATTAYLYLKYF